MYGSGRMKSSLLISFSGLDGAGKSTQIENLRVSLEAMGLHTTLRTFWIDRLKGLMLTLILGAPLLAMVLALFAYGGKFAWLWGWIASSRAASTRSR